jgi:hypothetical protein
MTHLKWRGERNGKSIFQKNTKGGLEKIKDAPRPCLSPEHNPPSHMVCEPGTYRYTCPMCGEITEFEVPMILC